MDRLLPSLRYTLRLLLKSPGFTITAELILGFGNVERCLACEAVVNNGPGNAYLITLGALCCEHLSFQKRNGAVPQCICPTSSPAYHGLASEAALHE